jgi:hypothetical protein
VVLHGGRRLMKENEFARIVTKALRQCNAEVLSIVGNKMQAPAWPDIFVAHRYWVGFIEFKGVETVLRRDQRIKIGKLTDKGVNVFVVRCPEFIEDEWGNRLTVFDMKSGKSLLNALRILSNAKICDNEMDS